MQVLHSVLPTVERNSIATEEEIEIDTLEAGLRKDAVLRDAVVFTPRLVGAWPGWRPPPNSGPQRAEAHQARGSLKFPLNLQQTNPKTGKE